VGDDADADAAAGRHLRDLPLWPPSDPDRPAFDRLVARAAGGEVVRFRTPYLVGGDRRTADATLVSVPVEGPPDGLLLVGHDAAGTDGPTPGLARAHQVVAGAPVGVTVTDPTRPDNPMTYVNERFLELTGYEAAELLGRNCRLLQGPETDPEAVATVRRAVARAEPVSVELLNYRKDGSTFWNRLTVAPLADEAGEVTAFVGFQEDVTERRAYRTELRRRNERLERFAATASHDLRGPLNLAQGRLALAREEHDSDHLAGVARAHRRMDALIRDILSVARGEVVGDPEWLRLTAVADDCWRPLAGAGATLDVRTDVRLLADRTGLERLVGNLLRNAVDHGGPGVTVVVGGLPDGFYVADDGPGLDPAVGDHPFTPGVTDGGEGAGLGLSIVADVCDRRGWTCSLVESASGGVRVEVRGVDTR
jgi:PAS domain S-box-containing protein